MFQLDLHHQIYLPVSQSVPLKPGGQTHISFEYLPPFKHDGEFS